MYISAAGLEKYASCRLNYISTFVCRKQNIFSSLFHFNELSMIKSTYVGIQMNTAVENSISYHHMFVVCYQKICQIVGSKEHLQAFSDCEYVGQIEKRGKEEVVLIKR